LLLRTVLLLRTELLLQSLRLWQRLRLQRLRLQRWREGRRQRPGGSGRSRRLGPPDSAAPDG
jgi:hypothetical protein